MEHRALQLLPSVPALLLVSVFGCTLSEAGEGILLVFGHAGISPTLWALAGAGLQFPSSMTVLQQFDETMGRKRNL